MSEVTFSNVAPVVPVRDLTRALGRYRMLGFSTRDGSFRRTTQTTASGSSHSSIVMEQLTMSVRRYTTCNWSSTVAAISREQEASLLTPYVD